MAGPCTRGIKKAGKGFLVALSLGLSFTMIAICVHFSSLAKYVSAIKDLGQENMNTALFKYGYGQIKLVAEQKLFTSSSLHSSSIYTSNTVFQYEHYFFPYPWLPFTDPPHLKCGFIIIIILTTSTVRAAFSLDSRQRHCRLLPFPHF